MADKMDNQANSQANIPAITASPLCDMLLDLMRKLHDGETDATSAISVLTENVTRIQNSRTSMQREYETLPEDRQQLQHDNMRAINLSLDEMEKGLQLAHSYIESGNESDYNQAVDIFRKVGNLGRLAFESYRAVEATAGPTEMPMVNVLHRMKEQYFAKVIEKVTFENVIANMVRNARTAALELSDKGDNKCYAKDALVRAYGDFADAIEAVKPAIALGEAAVQQALEYTAEVGMRTRKVMEDYTLQVATAGPTRMAHANLVLNMSSSWKEGRLAGDVFMRGVEVFRKSTEQLWREIESLAAIPNDCTAIMDEMPATREAFKSHFKALELFDRCVQGEPELYQEAYDTLVEAAEALAVCKSVFDGIGEQVGKIPCVRCGTYNEPSNRSCSNCGAHLFMPTGMSSTPSSTMDFQEEGGQVQYGGELVMTENLVKVFETVNKAAEGLLTPEQYLSVLDWFQKLVEDNLLDMEPEPELDNSGLTSAEKVQLRQIQEQIAQARADIEVGAQGMVAAIEHLRCYVDDNDSMSLLDGVRELRDSSSKVQKAAREVDTLVKACKRAAGQEIEGEAHAEEATKAANDGRV